MNNLLQNGDFSEKGKHWSGDHVTYFNGQAHISNLGYIEQTVTLPAELASGTKVRISFEVSELYGNVTAYLNQLNFETIREAGCHEITFSLKEATNVLMLRFQTSNSFALDNVLMVADNECVTVDVIKNGDFSEKGEHWSGNHVTYFNGQAHVRNAGYIEQTVTLPSELAAGNTVSLSCDISELYGSGVNINLNQQYCPTIREEGHHEITFSLEKATDSLTLRLNATNNFTLDNVKLLACLPAIRSH